MSLLQMLNKSQQEDASRVAAGLLGPQSPGQAAGPHIPNDLVLKLHQVQQHQVIIQFREPFEIIESDLRGFKAIRDVLQRLETF